MKYFKILWILTVFYLISLCACTTQKINQSSNDRLYKKENNSLNSKYIIYHTNDSISQLFYEISNEVLIYKKTDTSNYFYSDVKLLLKIFNEDNLNTAIDTSSIIIKDKQSEPILKFIKGNVFVNMKHGANYYVDINVIDNHKKVIYANKMFANKESNYSRQNFLITNFNNEVCFDSYHKPDDVVYLQSLRNKEKLFEVDMFFGNFKIALPPFVSENMQHFSYKPDSTYSVYINNNLFELQLPKKGFAHLKTNNETKDGVSFFVYESSFPKIKNTEQMILSTRYIMSKKEYDYCMSAADKKLAIDNFWLELSGSNERAKELIKKYYGRVKEANKLFSSYQEGWKTDRGMIYIVFGAPNIVTKRKNLEVWTFGEVGNPNSLVFSFIKVINPFTDNDYYLERNDYYKNPWYQAVDMWRQGKIYLDN